MSQASRKRKTIGVCDEQPRVCVCIAARDRLVEALIPPSTPLGPYEREEMMLEFSTARTWCEYCEPLVDGKNVCTCFRPRLRVYNMKGAQAEPTFPSLFDIRAAEIEEELAIARCQYCNSENGLKYELVYDHMPPLHRLRWIRDARLLPQLVYVDEPAITGPTAHIGETPPLNRPRVSERVAEME